MKKIEFYEIVITPTRIDFVVNEDKDGNVINDHYYYSYEEIEKPTKNQLLALFCTLSGSVYDSVFIDLEVDQFQADIVRKFTKAKVSFRKENYFFKSETRKTDNIILLNFSGGFDSLALWHLLPRNMTKLVSVNWGGWFQREYEFSKNFPIHKIETNIRKNSMESKINLALNDWRFMGASSIIYNNSLNAGFYSFGTVFDSSPTFITNYRKKNQDLVFNNLLNMYDIPFAKGITQVGSIMTVARFCPELIIQSLDSCAQKGSDKRRMKELFLLDIANKYDFDIPNFETTICENGFKKEFGAHYDYDFMALYILKKNGLDIANEIIKNIPAEAVELCKNLKMDFYERLNTNFLKDLPEKYLSEYLWKLGEARIIPYMQDDYEELQKVYSFIIDYSKRNR